MSLSLIFLSGVFFAFQELLQCYPLLVFCNINSLRHGRENKKKGIFRNKTLNNLIQLDKRSELHQHCRYIHTLRQYVEWKNSTYKNLERCPIFFSFGIMLSFRTNEEQQNLAFLPCSKMIGLPFKMNRCISPANMSDLATFQQTVLINFVLQCFWLIKLHELWMKEVKGQKVYEKVLI